MFSTSPHAPIKALPTLALRPSSALPQQQQQPARSTHTAVIVAVVAAALSGSAYLYFRGPSSSSKIKSGGDDDDDDAEWASPMKTEKKPSSPVVQQGSKVPVAAAAAAAAQPPLRVSKPDDDESDMFATAGGPKLFSPHVAFPSPSKHVTFGHAVAHNGKANTVASNVAAGGKQGAASKEGALTTTAAGYRAEPAEQVVWTDDIVERNKALFLVRALLTKVDGIEYEDSDDDEATDSDSTIVSLNYAIATELEGTARDELMEAYAMYEEERELHEEDAAAAEGDLTEMGLVLSKMVEYLDISNEREKLHIRREAKRFSDRIAASASNTNMNINNSTKQANGTLTKFVTANDEADHDEEEDYLLDDDARAAKQFFKMQRERDASVSASYAQMLSSGGTDLDRRLTSSAQTGGNDDEDMFEDEWGNEDDKVDDDGAEEEEDAAAFMEYLAQDDAKRRFLSRDEVQARRAERASGEFRFLTATGEDLEDVLAEMDPEVDEFGHYGINNFDDEDDYFDEDFYDENDDDEEGSDAEALAWTDEEKKEFEGHLLEKIYELAQQFGVTVGMGEREALKDEEARQRRHAAKAEQKKTQPVTRSNNNNKMQLPASSGDDEWEDVEE